MKHLLTTTAAFAVVGLASAAPAMADTAYMNGLFNTNPGWSTITMPDGTRCAAGCTELRYDYFTTQSAAAVAGAWMDAHNTPDDVLLTYSLSSSAALDALALRPNWQGTVVALGSPAKPYNGSGRAVPTTTNATVTFVTVQGDSVAQPGIGSAFLRHIFGYRGRNFAAETPVSSAQVTPNVLDNVYAPTPPPPPAPVVAPVSQRVVFDLLNPATWFRPLEEYDPPSLVSEPARVVFDWGNPATWFKPLWAYLPTPAPAPVVQTVNTEEETWSNETKAGSSDAEGSGESFTRTALSAPGDSEVTSSVRTSTPSSPLPSGDDGSNGTEKLTPAERRAAEKEEKSWTEKNRQDDGESSNDEGTGALSDPTESSASEDSKPPEPRTDTSSSGSKTGTNSDAGESRTNDTESGE